MNFALPVYERALLGLDLARLYHENNRKQICIIFQQYRSKFS
jgi:hypothetical protein